MNFDGYTIVDYIFEVISTRNFDKYSLKLHNEGVVRNQIKLHRYNYLLDHFSPDIIWIHDLQSAGYLLAESLPKDSIICLTTYGNDLYFYRNSEIHQNKIKSILSVVNFLHVETIRDKKIAIELGYSGEFFPIASATLNSYKLETDNLALNKIKSNFLLIKGDDGIRTLNKNFYKLLLKRPDQLRGKTIIVFASSDLDKYYAAKLHALNINILCLGKLPRHVFLKLLDKSKFFLSLTLSDGIANSVVEAVSLNCIPIITRHNGCMELFSKDELIQLININLNFNDTDLSKIIYLENNQTLIYDILLDLRYGINEYFSKDKQSLFLTFCQKNLID